MYSILINLRDIEVITMDTVKTSRIAGVLLAYPIAFAYLKYFLLDFSGENSVIKRVLFTMAFIVLHELIVRGHGRKPASVSYFWYIVMGIVALTSVTGISEPVSMLALHLCALYVTVVSCGILYEGRTGSFIAADLFNAGVLKAFSGFGNIFKDLAAIRKGKNGEMKASSFAAGVLSVLFMIPVFIVAVALLSGINSDFDIAVSKVLQSIDAFWFFENINFFVLAVPASLYIYGMISQSAGSTGEKERETFGKLVAWRQKCHKLSPIVASLITGAFVLLYIIFFVFEGSYLFSAFAGILPEEFTAAEYARQGFFELTGIMAINMLVYFVVSYLTKRDSIGRKISRGMITALMCESVVFAVISFSKLALYYSRFGYTPKRLLAIWGTLIFAAGAVMVIASIFKRKDMSRPWIYFTTVSFALMSIISSIMALVI